MFASIKSYLITNKRATLFVFCMLFLGGIFSFFSTPKSYDLHFFSPVSEITIPCHGYTKQEIQERIILPLQDAFLQRQGIEDVRGRVQEEKALLRVSFAPTEDAETIQATLYTDILALQGREKVGQPIREKIHTDSFPVYSLALSRSGRAHTSGNAFLSLEQRAAFLLDQLKTVPGVSEGRLLGAENNTLTLEIDLEKAEQYGIRIEDVETVLKNNLTTKSAGWLYTKGTKNEITVATSVRTREDIEKLVVQYAGPAPIYIHDIATIRRGSPRKHTQMLLGTKEMAQETVILALAKKPDRDIQRVGKALEKKVEALQKTLPSGYTLTVVQEEHTKVASVLYTLLLSTLVSCICIFLLLAIFSGYMSALLGTAIFCLARSVPFICIWLLGEAISPAFLVTGIAISGLFLAVFLRSEKLFSPPFGIGILCLFLGIFWLFPSFGVVMLYGLLFLLVSVVGIVCANIFFPREKKEKKECGHREEKCKQMYEDVLSFFVQPEKKWKRTIFRYALLVLFLVACIVPLGVGIFTIDMFPKQNEKDLSLWVDLPEKMSFEETQKVTKNMHAFFSFYIAEDQTGALLLQPRKIQTYQIIDNLVYSLGEPGVLTFAEYMQDGGQRTKEHGISIRIRLVAPEKRTISRTEFIVAMRKKLGHYLQKIHPGVSYRFVDPIAGSPAFSRFLLTVSGEPATAENEVNEVANWLFAKIYPLLREEGVVDIRMTAATYKTKYEIQIEQEKVRQAGLTAEQIQRTVEIIFAGRELGEYTVGQTKETATLFLSASGMQKDTDDIFSRIFLRNQAGESIPLLEVVRLVPNRADGSLEIKNKAPTVLLYGEMENGSPLYPLFALARAVFSPLFSEKPYSVVRVGIDGFYLKDIETKKMYAVRRGGDKNMLITSIQKMISIVLCIFCALCIFWRREQKSRKISRNMLFVLLLGVGGISVFYAFLAVFGKYSYTFASFFGTMLSLTIGAGYVASFTKEIIALQKKGIVLQEASKKAGRKELKESSVITVVILGSSIPLLGTTVWNGVVRSMFAYLPLTTLLLSIALPIFFYDIYKKNAT